MESKLSTPRTVIYNCVPGLFVLIAFLLISFSIGVAGVLVAPTSVFMSENDRTGRITVQNPSDKPKEISIHIGYGIPVSDSMGDVQITLQDSGVTDPHCAKDWIKAFPEKIVLAPNSTQVIRLRANPPKNLTDGEYWARIVVRSQEGQTSLPTPEGGDKITAKLNMIMQTAIMLKYRTGNLLSKLEVLKTDIQQIDTTVIATVLMANRGNVSYVGVLTCRLLDATGKEISKNDIDLAVYYELTRRIKLPIKDSGFARPFKVEISITTAGRTDIAETDIIAGNVVTYSMLVR
jgi:P pilus assembly chaperone PapD